jgi:hypothetical protein
MGKYGGKNLQNFWKDNLYITDEKETYYSTLTMETNFEFSSLVRTDC